MGLCFITYRTKFFGIKRSNDDSTIVVEYDMADLATWQQFSNFTEGGRDSERLTINVCLHAIVAALVSCL